MDEGTSLWLFTSISAYQGLMTQGQLWPAHVSRLRVWTVPLTIVTSAGRLAGTLSWMYTSFSLTTLKQWVRPRSATAKRLNFCITDQYDQVNWWLMKAYSEFILLQRIRLQNTLSKHFTCLKVNPIVWLSLIMFARGYRARGDANS